MLNYKYFMTIVTGSSVKSHSVTVDHSYSIFYAKIFSNFHNISTILICNRFAIIE